MISVNRHRVRTRRASGARGSADITSSFAGILDIADDAIISVDATQRITLFNQGAERFLVIQLKEILGQPLDLLLPLRFHCVHRQYVVDFTKSSEKPKQGRSPEIFAHQRW